MPDIIVRYRPGLGIGNGHSVFSGADIESFISKRRLSMNLMATSAPESQSKTLGHREKRSWSQLLVEYLPVFAVLVGLLLLPEKWWSNYFEFRDSVGSFLFVQHRVASVLVALVLLSVGCWLEYRAFRVHRKLSYFTPFRVVIVVAVLSIYVFVDVNAV